MGWTPRCAIAALASLLIAVPAAQAAFPGTNGDIAFERSDDILLMPPGGSPAPLVTTGVNDLPVISPDGSTIAYQSVGPDERNDIRAIRFDGTGDVSLSDVTGGPYADQHPAWSPDGTRIAFMSFADGTWDIWTMRSDGTDRVQVAQAGTSQQFAQPAWSPDGSTIAFTVTSTIINQSPPPPAIATVSATGGTPVGYQADAQRPTWSPDGSRIAYQAPVSSNVDVYVDDFPQTAAPRRQITSHAAGDGFPSFSPDGARILFGSNRAGDGVIRLYSAASTGTETDVVQMTFPTGPPGDLFSDWGPARAAGMPPPPIPPPPPDPGPQQLSPPQRGKTVNADPVSGDVFVKLPEGATEKRRYAWANAAGGLAVPKGFIPLTEARQLPVGTVFDTTRGVVGLTVARDLLGTRTQHAEFSRGRFVWKQPETKALTTLTLRGGGLKGCRKRRGQEKVTTAGTRRRRSLFGSGTGRFRTRGRRSTATVRGTTWVQKDTCRGTLTRVREGTVVVRDVAKKKPIILSTVDKRRRTRHFARAPRFR